MDTQNYILDAKELQKLPTVLYCTYCILNSHQIDTICVFLFLIKVPFLAVARALGDLWSYNAKDDIYVVSPDPDLHVYDLNVLKDRCLILGTDGVWNVVSPEMAVQSVSEAERNNEKHMIDPHGGHTWVNPSKKLVDFAIDRWNVNNLRADNTSVVTVMLDPPGPPRAQVHMYSLYITT